MINLHIDELEKKYGNMNKFTNGQRNCQMNYITTETYLNYLFSKSDIDDIKDIYSKVLDTEIPEYLYDFYTMYNGCNLFHNSLCIFGKSNELTYKGKALPYDIVINNYNSHVINNSPFVLFGTIIGNCYNVAFKKNELNKVYVLYKNNNEVRKEFDSLQEFWDYYFFKIMNEYDTNGRLKHIWEDAKGFPSLENMMYEDYFDIHK